MLEEDKHTVKMVMEGCCYSQVLMEKALLKVGRADGLISQVCLPFSHSETPNCIRTFMQNRLGVALNRLTALPLVIISSIPVLPLNFTFNGLHMVYCFLTPTYLAVYSQGSLFNWR